MTKLTKLAMREQLLKGTAAYLLDHGIGDLSLRPLAKALGTSDRMLLYYFRDKDELVVAAVRLVAEGIFQFARAECESKEFDSPADFGEALWAFFVDEKNRHVASLFFEIDVLSLRQPRLYGETAKFLMDEWVKLVATGLERAGVPRKTVQKIAVGLSAEIHGLALLALVQGEKTASAALKALLDRMRHV